jgi:hypothetical protein
MVSGIVGIKYSRYLINIKSAGICDSFYLSKLWSRGMFLF